VRESETALRNEFPPRAGFEVAFKSAQET